MRELSKDRFERARAFIQTSARPLERAVFDYEWEKGDAAAVLRELGRFQNADGGFGHALEPDVRLGDSSVLATTVALQTLRELRTGSEHPMVRGAIGYLIGVYDPSTKAWAIVPPNVADAPRAPWWQYDLRNPTQPINPRAEVLGYFYEHQALVPSAMLREVREATFAHLQAQEQPLGMYDFYAVYRLARTAELPEADAAWLWQRLRRDLDAIVCRDPAQWGQHVARPLDLVPTADSPLRDMVDREIAIQLDVVIDSQGADGAWSPNWSYPGGWPEVEQEWKGVMTVKTLATLGSFGRIASE